MNRRPCLDLKNRNCNKSRPPSADQPNYIGTTSSYSDLLNYDIKVPGEHRINGERFDAEIQMLHIHPEVKAPNQVTSIGVMIRATSNGFNKEFQDIIDEFQDVYDTHAQECERKREKQRNLRFGENRSLSDDEEIHQVKSRQLNKQKKNRFNPYTEALMPNIYFYRYNGSLTEPPCKAVPWWVMTEPMIISKEQLAHVKNILFTHVSEDCKRTSVHNDSQSSARPIFGRGKRLQDGIQKCTKVDFLPDKIKGRGRGRECK